MKLDAIVGSKKISAVAAVVVTFNRKTLLKQCLSSLMHQTLPLKVIHVVDNASTDGTLEDLSRQKWLDRSNIEILPLSENTGGAGGFTAGLSHAIKNSEWIWMMDDDADPHPNALEELMKIASDPGVIYGSLAVNGSEPSWTTKIINPPLGVVALVDDVPNQAEVNLIPFLGFLIHRDLVQKIGLPDKNFFIAADDAEYCVRARHAGIKLMIAGKSRIEHPKTKTENIDIFGRKIVYLSLPPWKRYYDTRNRLLIARKYYGLRILTEAIPGTFARLAAALFKESNKLAQMHAFAAGTIDGLMGKKGRRHQKWRIKQ